MSILLKEPALPLPPFFLHLSTPQTRLQAPGEPRLDHSEPTTAYCHLESLFISASVLGLPAVLKW